MAQPGVILRHTERGPIGQPNRGFGGVWAGRGGSLRPPAGTVDRALVCLAKSECQAPGNNSPSGGLLGVSR
jgi:hypothetical protein